MPCVVPQSMLRDDDVLGHVGELAREITGVSRFEGRIGQTLACAVRAAEVLEHRQTFAEVGLDGRFDDLARRLGHQTAHAGQLANLLDAAARAGVRHEEDRVHVSGGAIIALQLVHHFFGDDLARMRPGVKHLVVPLHVRDDAALVQLVLLEDLFLRLGDDLAICWPE